MFEMYSSFSSIKKQSFKRLKNNLRGHSMSNVPSVPYTMIIYIIVGLQITVSIHLRKQKSIVIQYLPESFLLYKHFPIRWLILIYIYIYSKTVKQKKKTSHAMTFCLLKGSRALQRCRDRKWKPLSGWNFFSIELYY